MKSLKRVTAMQASHPTEANDTNDADAPAPRWNADPGAEFVLPTKQAHHLLVELGRPLTIEPTPSSSSKAPSGRQTDA
jgi:hypothetical protein